MIETTLELNKVNEISPDEDTIVFNDEGKVETYYIQKKPDGTLIVGDLNSPYHTELRDDGMYVCSDTGLEFSHFNKDGFEIGSSKGKLRGTDKGITFVEILPNGTEKEHFSMITNLGEEIETSTYATYYDYTYGAGRTSKEITMHWLQSGATTSWQIPTSMFYDNLSRIELTFDSRDYAGVHKTFEVDMGYLATSSWDVTEFTKVDGSKWVRVNKAYCPIKGDEIPTTEKWKFSYGYIYWKNTYSKLTLGDWWVDSLRHSSGTL